MKLRQVCTLTPGEWLYTLIGSPVLAVVFPFAFAFNVLIHGFNVLGRDDFRREAGELAFAVYIAVPLAILTGRVYDWR